MTEEEGTVLERRRIEIQIQKEEFEAKKIRLEAELLQMIRVFPD